MKQDSVVLYYIHLTNGSGHGSYEWKGKLDLLNIVMIGLAEKLPEHELCRKGNRGISLSLQEKRKIHMVSHVSSFTSRVTVASSSPSADTVKVHEPAWYPLRIIAVAAPLYEVKLPVV